MAGALLHHRRQRQQRVVVNFGRGNNRSHLRLADGQGAGFIERHWRTWPSCSSAAPPLISAPRRAATARPEVMAAGVEMTSAHGQPISSSVSPL